MEEYFQVRPNLLQMRLASDFHHAVQDGEHPRRYTTDVGDVFVHRLAGYTLSLDFKIGNQRCFLLRYTH